MLTRTAVLLRSRPARVPIATISSGGTCRDQRRPTHPARPERPSLVLLSTGSVSHVRARHSAACAVRTSDTVPGLVDNGNGRATVPNGTFRPVTSTGGHSCRLKNDDTLALLSGVGAGPMPPSTSPNRATRVAPALGARATNGTQPTSSGRVRGNGPTSPPQAIGWQKTLGLALLFWACAPPALQSAGPPVHRIEYAEFQRYAGFSVYQVVERSFPTALRARPLTMSRTPWETELQVYVGGRWFGDVSILHDIPITSVLELRFLTPMEALQRHGRESQRGAIELVLKR